MGSDVQQFWVRSAPRVVGRRDDFEWDDRAERAPTELLAPAELARRVALLRAAERRRQELVPVAPPRVRFPEVGTLPRRAAAPVAMSLGVALGLAACFVVAVAGTLATVAIH